MLFKDHGDLVLIAIKRMVLMAVMVMLMFVMMMVSSNDGDTKETRTTVNAREWFLF